MTINYQQPFYQGPYNGYPYIYPQPPLGGFTPDLGINPNQIENILRLNKGKIATIYMSFEGSQWGSKIFRGEIVEAGRDHIILHDIQNKINYLLLTVYLSYITFDDTIDYNLNYDKE